MNARIGPESMTCLDISSLVLRGFVVVIMAPRDMTERQTTGKRMEFGERRRTTSPLLMPMEESADERESTPRQSSRKLRCRPDAASM